MTGQVVGWGWGVKVTGEEPMWEREVEVRLTQLLKAGNPEGRQGEECYNIKSKTMW